MFHITRILLYTIYLEKQKSCKVNAILTLMDSENILYMYVLWP